MNDTDHLNNSEANKARLESSIAQLKAGEAKPRDLTDSKTYEEKTVAEMQADQSVPITDLDQFINQLVHWHNGAKKRVQHASQIPGDGSITLEYGGEDRIMTGELHTGFLMGLAYAYAELGTLPFGYEEVSLDEASEPPAA